VKIFFTLILTSQFLLFNLAFAQNNDLLKCSAYHFKAKLNNQYASKKKYEYHDNYFNNLKDKYLQENKNSSEAAFILSITSIMESWSYIAQEKGHSFANMKIESDYNSLCNTISIE
jgi:hypothetical protein